MMSRRRAYAAGHIVLISTMFLFFIAPLFLAWRCDHYWVTATSHAAFFLGAVAGIFWGTGFFNARFDPEKGEENDGERKYYFISIGILLLAAEAYLFPMVGSQMGRAVGVAIAALSLSLATAVGIGLIPRIFRRHWSAWVIGIMIVLFFALGIPFWGFYLPGPTAALASVCRP